MNRENLKGAQMFRIMSSPNRPYTLKLLDKFLYDLLLINDKFYHLFSFLPIIIKTIIFRENLFSLLCLI